MEKIAWANRYGDFELLPDDGDVELLLPEHGWFKCQRLYSLSQMTPISHDTWSVFRTSEQDRMPLKPAGPVCIVRRSWSTFEKAPGTFDASEELSYWFAPKSLEAWPAHLRGQGSEAIESWLLESVASRTRLQTLFALDQFDSALALVDSIEPTVHDELALLAKRLGASAGISLDEKPVAAARAYSESDPGNNLNQTVVCNWRWRLSYRAALRGVHGFLTLEASATGFDSRDQD